MDKKTAVIIGAGPAGLTAAYELLRRTDIKPVIFESTGDIGGISKTVNYKGNRIDIGGHRFFSKSDRVMEWWRSILPVQGPWQPNNPSTPRFGWNNATRWGLDENGPNPDETDEVMLVRSRKSRILYLNRFFDYPVSLSLRTIANLGPWRTSKIGASYLKARLKPTHPERSLEDFLINRFGKELYLTFFKDYTEKVWGTPCADIKPEWGAQRIKGLSISKALIHALRKLICCKSLAEDRNIETTLIEQFWYPKYGPGQLWEAVAKKIVDLGGELHLQHRVTGTIATGGTLKEVEVLDESKRRRFTASGDFFFSTMPVKDLIEGMRANVPEEVRRVARGLVYRDFITVGLLLKKLIFNGDRSPDGAHQIVPDNWIYVQEPELKVGRLQLFNNWSPYMVRDPHSVWIGHEYFCNENDALWSSPDHELIGLAISELSRIGKVQADDVLDSTVIRMPKAYPAYFGSYDQFPIIRDFVDHFGNLFLIGRNGMHRYNNQDHSMLAAMTAVEKIIARDPCKSDIWTINIEQEYHEAKGPTDNAHYRPSRK
jgi:protoporphyrinogen oxidase